jgi:hypothetical protein
MVLIVIKIVMGLVTVITHLKRQETVTYVCIV